MHAQPGDWLIVERADAGREPRRALIEEVTGDGQPPYLVRWLDTGEESFVFPWKARIQTREERADAGGQAEDRAAEVQRLIRARRGQP